MIIRIPLRYRRAVALTVGLVLSVIVCVALVVGMFWAVFAYASSGEVVYAGVVIAGAAAYATSEYWWFRPLKWTMAHTLLPECAPHDPLRALL